MNGIFEAYQKQADDGTLVFRRWPMRAVRSSRFSRQSHSQFSDLSLQHACRGDLLTHYFSQNSMYWLGVVGLLDDRHPYSRNALQLRRRC